MNYISEIIAFEQWLETHYLPTSPQLLWYKLINLCNKSGWSEWVQVDNLRLMATTQMGREATLIKARDELIKAGLIEYQKGKKGCPNRYRIISFSEINAFKKEVQNVDERAVQSVVEKNTCKNEAKSEVYRVVESGVYPVVKSEVESVGIYKQNINKTKHIKTPPISPLVRIEEFLSAYPKTCDRFLVEREYATLILTGKMSEDDLVSSAKNYAEACKIEERSERYIKNAENFLRDFVFERYLPGAYKKPEAKKQGNKFNDFPQRDYGSDGMSAMERQLLGR